MWGRVTLATAVLVACAAAASGQSKASAVQIKVSGVGRSPGACAENAKSRALEPALRSIQDQERQLGSVSLQCMATTAKPAVRFVRAKDQPPAMVGADRCEVVFSVAYDRRAVLAAGRACLRSDVRVPVGLVLRAERAGAIGAESRADADLAQAATSQITTGLARSNFEIVSLPQFQKDFLDLKMMLGPCALTMERSDQDWSERCKTPVANYMAARDALTARLSDAVAATPSLRGWRECGGLFVSGEVKIVTGAQDVTATLIIDYYALARGATFIAPHSESRPVAIDLGGEAGAVSRVLALLADGTVADARQKLAAFAHSHGCASPQNGAHD